MHSWPQAFHVALSASFWLALPYSSIWFTCEPAKEAGSLARQLVERKVHGVAPESASVAVEHIQRVVIGPERIPGIAVRVVPFVNPVQVQEDFDDFLRRGLRRSRS